MKIGPCKTASPSQNPGCSAFHRGSWTFFRCSLSPPAAEDCSTGRKALTFRSELTKVIQAAPRELIRVELVRPAFLWRWFESNMFFLP